MRSDDRSAFCVSDDMNPFLVWYWLEKRPTE